MTSWFNVRAANTGPLVRQNVEADDHAMLGRVRECVLATIRSH
jgi:phosphomannomutase